MADLDAEIRAKIDSFLSDISQLVKLSALASVQDALGGGAGTPSRRRGRPAGPRASAPTGKRRGRTPSPEIAAIGEKVLAHVSSNPGLRLEELGVALGTPTKLLKRPVAKLVADGKLRTEGQRRGMRYSVGSGRPRATRKAGKRRKKA